MSTAEDAYRRTIPAALVRMLASGLGDQEFVDPDGERFTYRGIGTQMRERESARREEYKLLTGDDPWYARPGILNKMLAGGATLGGVFGGSAFDPTNYLGAGAARSLAARLGIDMAIGAGQDVAAQGLDIGSGVQDRYSGLQTLGSATVNAFLPAAVQGVGQAVNRMLPGELFPGVRPDEAPARAGGGAQRASQQAPSHRVVASETIPQQERERLLDSGEYRVDPNDPTTIYRVVGREPMPTTIDPFTGAEVPAPGQPVAAGAATAPPAAGARVDVGDGAPQVLPRADGGVETLQPDGSIVVSRPDAPDEIIPPARAVEPVEVLLPDGNTAVLPRAAALAEDVGAPGRAPDEVLLGPVVRGLDDEFGIPAQPSRADLLDASPAVARARAAVAQSGGVPLLRPGDPAARVDRDVEGNIRMSNIESEADIDAVLSTARALGGIEKQGGVQTFAETKELADLLGLTVDQLLATPNGKAMNAPEITAARNLMVAQLEKVDQRFDDWDADPTPEKRAAYLDAVYLQIAIQEKVSGIETEITRATSALRIKARSMTVTQEMLDGRLGSLSDKKLREVGRRIRDASREGGPVAGARAARKELGPRFLDALIEFRYFGMLSG
jgi:hypothetical protein